jgi:hypothetical protein
VTVVGDVGRSWLSVAALRQPHDLPDAIHVLLATNVALDKAWSTEPETTRSNSHATDASSSTTCMVIVRRVDSRTVSRDLSDEPAMVKPIGRLDHIAPKLCLG